MARRSLAYNFQAVWYGAAIMALCWLATPSEVRFAAGCLLEGSGFELPVPREKRYRDLTYPGPSCGGSSKSASSCGLLEKPCRGRRGDGRPGRRCKQFLPLPFGLDNVGPGGAGRLQAPVEVLEGLFDLRLTVTTCE